MSLLVAIVTSKVRMLFAIHLLPILARVGIIGGILFAPWAVSSLMFGGAARSAHPNAMRLAISNRSEIC